MITLIHTFALFLLNSEALESEDSESYEYSISDGDAGHMISKCIE